MSHAATSNARSRALLKKADRIRARGELIQARRAIFQILIVISLAVAVGFVCVSALDPMTTGLPLASAIGVPCLFAMGLISLIGLRLVRDVGFQGLLEVVRLLKEQARYRLIGRGNGVIKMVKIDHHAVNIVRFAPRECESAAAHLSALATAAKRVLSSTLHSTSSLRARATA